MGGCAQDPKTTHKRPKWRIALLEAKSSLLWLNAEFNHLKTCFKLYDNNPSFGKFEIHRVCEEMINACHKCRNEEFRLILEDELINVLMPLGIEAKRRGKTDWAIDMLGELDKRMKVARKRLKELSHIVRHNQYTQRDRNNWS